MSSRLKLGLCILALAAGCSDKDVRKIEKVTGKAWNKAEKAGQQLGAELGLDLERAASRWEDLTLPGRVEQRLRWDQLLRGADIKVQIEQDQVVLSGTIASETQRRRAVELAESTDGVQNVREALQIKGDK